MKLLTLTTLCAVSAISLALATAVSAQPRIARGDTNKDGSLSLAEFQALQGQRLMRLDGDGDGRISLAEWLAQPRGPNANPAADPAKAFTRMDRNKDGNVDRGEIDAVLGQRFARLDADRNGQLASNERSDPRRDRAGARAASKP